MNRLACVLLLLAGLLLFALNLAPALLPRAGGLSVAARFAWAPTCHQRAERSLAIAGRPLGACARCTGLHASAVVGGLLLLLSPRRRFGARWSSRAVALVGCVPLVVDAQVGMIVPTWDHPWLRLLTGVLAGSMVFLSVGWCAGAARTPAGGRHGAR